MTASWRTEMRTMFYVYLFVIIGGIVFFTAMGLTHN
jgi:hypothetical protein